MRFPAIFSNTKLPNWISRIKELSSNEKWHDVISCYKEMKFERNNLVDYKLFPPVLKACSYASHIDGKCVHAYLIKTAFDSFTSIGNSIMSFYFKCRELENAVSVFDAIRIKDSVSWNVLILGYLDYGAFVEGFLQFSNARVAAFDPNVSTLLTVIRACCRVGARLEGVQLHAYVVRSGFLGSCSIWNSLLCFYVDVNMECARNLFDEMPERDVISWNVMIGGYIQSLEAKVGLHLFQKMLSASEIEPDGMIVANILRACASLVNITVGRLIHGQLVCRGLDHELFVKNCLIDMYSKCNDVDSAWEVFNGIANRNNVSWNSMLSGLVLNEKFSEALSLTYSMSKDGIEADEVTLVNFLQICKYFTNTYECRAVHCVAIRQGCESNTIMLSSLIDAYAKCSLLEHAWEVFSRTMERDVVLWSTMISGFAHNGHTDEAIAVFKKMNETESPNSITIINLLEACSVSAELKRSKWAHGIAIRRGFAAEVKVGTAIVDLYSKCGDIEASRKVFNQIPERNIATWSAMVAAYGMNGLAYEALALLAEMKLHEVRPNALTYLSVLTSCSHCGLVEEGLSTFKSMLQDEKIEPGFEHYSCVVDMLSRAGNLDGAMELIRTMPESFKARASIWGSLLSACRKYKNTKLGERAIAQVLELEPLNSAGYLLASSMYAAEGFWDDVARMRLLAKQRGAIAAAGYSLLYVDNNAHRFISGDESHPQATKILYMLNQLHYCMKVDKTNFLFGDRLVKI